MENAYQIKLSWKRIKNKFYKNYHEAKIWNGHMLSIEYNGEDFYNVTHWDRYGNEIEGVCGAETWQDAMKEAGQWVAEECSEFLLKQ